MDGQLLLFIQNNIRLEWLNPVVVFITNLGGNAVFYFAVIALLLIFPQTRRVGFMCLVAFFFMYVINNLCIKNIVNRTRPYEVIKDLVPIGKIPSDQSFPSGHTAGAFSIALVLFFRAKKYIGIPALIFAVIIAVSRLYVGVHYPTDVLGGFAVGCLCAFLGIWLGGMAYSFIGRKLAFLKKGSGTAD